MCLDDSIAFFIFKNEGILLLLHETLNVTRAFERDLGTNIRIITFEISTSTLILTFNICGCSTCWAIVRSAFYTYSRTPIILKSVIRLANYPDRLGPSGSFVENSTKLTCHEITGYRIKYSTVLWLIELHNRSGRNV